MLLAAVVECDISSLLYVLNKRYNTHPNCYGNQPVAANAAKKDLVPLRCDRLGTISQITNSCASVSVCDCYANRTHIAADLIAVR